MVPYDMNPAIVEVAKLVILAVIGLVAISLIDKFWPGKR